MYHFVSPTALGPIFHGALNTIPASPNKYRDCAPAFPAIVPKHSLVKDVLLIAPSVLISTQPVARMELGSRILLVQETLEIPKTAVMAALAPSVAYATGPRRPF